MYPPVPTFFTVVSPFSLLPLSISYCAVAHTLPVTVLQSFFDVLLLESLKQFPVFASNQGGGQISRKTGLLWFFCNLSGHSTLKVPLFKGHYYFQQSKSMYQTSRLLLKYSCPTNISLLVSLHLKPSFIVNLCAKVF